VTDLSNEPEMPEEEIDWDEIPDRSETFVNLAVALIENIKQRDLRIPYVECEDSTVLSYSIPTTQSEELVLRELLMEKRFQVKPATSTSHCQRKILQRQLN
jgi:hypothetical protein